MHCSLTCKLVFVCFWQAIFEIITSEHSYLHSLGILVRHFKSNEALKKTMTATEHHHLFSNISVIHQVSKRWAQLSYRLVCVCDGKLVLLGLLWCYQCVKQCNGLIICIQYLQTLHWAAHWVFSSCQTANFVFPLRCVVFQQVMDWFKRSGRLFAFSMSLYYPVGSSNMLKHASQTGSAAWLIWGIPGL